MTCTSSKFNQEPFAAGVINCVPNKTVPDAVIYPIYHRDNCV